MWLGKSRRVANGLTVHDAFGVQYGLVDHFWAPYERCTVLEGHQPSRN